MANTADDKLMIFYHISPEIKIWHYMQIISVGDNLHEMSKPASWKNKKKIFQYVVFGKFTQSAKR